MKKIISLILAILMVLSIAPAMAEKVDEIGNYKIVDEPLTLKMVLVDDPSHRVDSEMWLFKKIEQYTGIKLDVELISNDAWVERKALMFVADELPDIIVGNFTVSELSKYSEDGQLVDINELYETVMPNYKAYVEQYTAEEFAKLYNNGKMLGMIGNAGDGVIHIPGARAFINKAWLEKLNLAVPTTWDEFYNVLVAFRDGDPNGNGLKDEIPMSGYDGYQVDAFITSDLGISVTWSEMSDWYEGENGSLEYVYTSDRYHEYLRRMSQLYAEGLLDSEYYTQTNAQEVAKGYNMQIGCSTFGAPFALVGNEPEAYEQYTAFLPLKSEWSEGFHYGDMLSGTNVYFTYKNEHLEESAKLIDFFYTEAYGVLQQGPEKGSEIIGSWDGVGGWYWLDEAKTQWYLPFPVEQGFASSYDWTVTCVAPSVIRGAARSSEFFKQCQQTPGDVHLVEIFNDVWATLKPGFPQTYSLTAEETDEIVLIEAELEAYIDQMEAKFVIGELSLEKDWDAFQKHLKDELDVETYVKVHQQAYARFLEVVDSIR